ncbi:MAG: hypothetical protein Q7S40_34355 [Opitutaceae bacterium]|nr:hypothetical protein [Opitutaceae bacterium]
MISLSRSLAFMGVLLVAGCQSTKPKDYQPTLARFYLESADGRGMAVTLPRSEVRMSLNAQPVLREADIVDVDLVQVELGKCLAFRLTGSAARDCYRMSASHQGRRLVLLINGEALGARRIDAPIGDGMVLVFVEVPESALPKLVADLKRTAVVLQRELARK